MTPAGFRARFTLSPRVQNFEPLVRAFGAFRRIAEGPTPLLISCASIKKPVLTRSSRARFIREAQARKKGQRGAGVRSESRAGRRGGVGVQDREASRHASERSRMIFRRD